MALLVGRELQALAVVGEEDQLAGAPGLLARADAPLGDDRQRVVRSPGARPAALPPAARRTSSIVIGVKVWAGPRAPSYAPAMTRTSPPPGSATRGMSAAVIGW